MFPGARLPRTLTTHTKTCARTHTHIHTRTLAQGTKGMGSHVGWLWGPDVFMSGGVRLGFTLILGVTAYTYRRTHKGWAYGWGNTSSTWEPCLLHKGSVVTLSPAFFRLAVAPQSGSGQLILCSGLLVLSRTIPALSLLLPTSIPFLRFGHIHDLGLLTSPCLILFSLYPAAIPTLGL